MSMFFLCPTSTRLGLWSVLPKVMPRKPQQIQWDLNPGSLAGHKAHILPLSHVGRHGVFKEETYPTFVHWYNLIHLTWPCSGLLLNPFPNNSWFLHLWGTSLLKHYGKRRNCLWQAISPFPIVFSTHLENSQPFSSNLKLLSENSFSLEESEICRLGNG